MSLNQRPLSSSKSQTNFKAFQIRTNRPQSSVKSPQDNINHHRINFRSGNSFQPYQQSSTVSNLFSHQRQPFISGITTDISKFQNDRFSIYSQGENTQISLESLQKIQTSNHTFNEIKSQNSPKSNLNRDTVQKFRDKNPQKPKLKNSELFWMEVQNYKLKNHSQLLQGSFKELREQEYKKSMNKIYQKLQQEYADKRQQEEDERKRIEEALKQEQRQKEKELQAELEKIKQQEEWNNQIEQLRIKRQYERRISIWDVILALHYEYLHVQLPGSKKLAKLISTQFLNILNYKAIENRMQKQNNGARVRRTDLRGASLAQTIESHVLLRYQITELQEKLNEGLKIGGGDNDKFIRKIDKLGIILNGSEIFSQNVLKFIKKLQSALKLGVFRIVRPNIQKFLGEAKSTFEQKDSKENNRKKVQVGMGKVMTRKRNIVDLDQFERVTKRNASSDSMNSPIISSKRGQMGNVSVFTAVKVAKLMIKKQIRSTEQNMRKFLQPQKDLVFKVAKQVQIQHYPAIRFIGLHESLLVVWLIKFKDISADSRSLIVYFSGEGQGQHFFRLDIPVNRNIQAIEKQPQMTIWPTIHVNLEGWMETRGYKELLNQYWKFRVKPLKYSLNFIQGINSRTLPRLQPIDIESIVATKSILQFVKYNQVARIKKITGENFEILPQLRSIISLYLSEVFLVNVPCINHMLYQLRRMEHYFKEIKRISILEQEENEDNLKDLEREFDVFLFENQTKLNATLFFRFISSSRKFYYDQKLLNIYNIHDKIIYIQSKLINIDDLLKGTSETLSKEVRRFCLFQLKIGIKDQVKLDMQPVMFSLNSLETGSALNLLNPSQMSTPLGSPDKSQQYSKSAINRIGPQWEFQKQYFDMYIDVIFFEKDSQNVKALYSKVNKDSIKYRASQILQERIIQPLKLTFQQFTDLTKGVLQDQGQISITIDKEMVDEILKSILMNKILSKKKQSAIDILLKEAFTVDIQNRQIQVKKKYQYLIFEKNTFIDSIYQVQKHEKVPVIRYGLFPNEYQFLIFKDIAKNDPNSQYTSVFNALFQQIEVNELQFVQANSSKITLFSGEDSTQNIESSFNLNLQKFKLLPSATFKHIRLQISNENVKLFSRFENFSFVLLTSNPQLKWKIAQTETMNKQLREHQISQIVKNLVFQNDKVPKFVQRMGVRYVYIPRQVTLNRQDQLKQTYNKIKFQIMGHSPSLMNWLNCVKFIFNLKNYIGQQCIVYVSLYYSNFQEEALNTIGRERVYAFDEQHLFINLELFDINSRLKKHNIILSKYDLKEIFGIQPQPKITAELMYTWIQNIVERVRFEKRFISKIPYFFSIQNNQAKSPNLSDQQQSFNYVSGSILGGGSINSRSINSFLSLTDYEYVRWTNDFSKNKFTKDRLEKRFIESSYQEFRTIGHFIHKVSFLYNVDKGSFSLVANQHDNNKQQICVEFMIVTIMAHTQLNIWRVTYYFPKTKKRLSTNLNPLTLQEIDQKYFDSFQLLQFRGYFNSYDELEQLILRTGTGTGKEVKQPVKKPTIQESQFRGNYLMSRKSTYVQGKFLPVQLHSKPTPRLSRLKSSNAFFVYAQPKNEKLNEGVRIASDKLEKVNVLVRFTRNMNERSVSHSEQERLLEIKFWNYILEQGISLCITKSDQIDQIDSLEKQVIEHYNSQNSSQEKLIIGQKFMKKKRFQRNLSQRDYEVQSWTLNANLKFLENENIQFLLPFKTKKNPTYSIKIGFQEYPILEFIKDIQFRVERVGVTYMECFLEEDNTMSRMHELIRFSKKDERYRNTAFKEAIGIFTSSKPIPYALSTSYNLNIRFHSISKGMRYTDHRINLRELLNLFIADGLFKSQTNYINSKLTLADIEILCQYLTYKIREQNFLDVAYIMHTPAPPQIPLIKESDVSKESQRKDFEYPNTIYSFVSRFKGQRVLYQLQIFIENKKVVVNQFIPQSAKFSQKDLFFDTILNEVEIFEILVYGGEVLYALKLLSYVCDRFY